MWEKLDKIIKKIHIVAGLALLIEIIWYIGGFPNFPLWLAFVLAGYGIIATIYYVIKKKREE